VQTMPWGRQASTPTVWREPCGLYSQPVILPAALSAVNLGCVARALGYNVVRLAGSKRTKRFTVRTVLLVWELGGGVSHLFNLLPLAAQLRRRGHRVCAVVRNLVRAEKVFSRLGVECMQAPLKPKRLANRIDPLRTFAHVLYNTGYGDEEILRNLGNAWHTLFEEVRPDLILFEHSPVALLAARTIPAKKVVVGNGFCCPPDCSPWPDLRPWLPEDSARQEEEENRVLTIANRVLEDWGTSPLDRLSQLYQDVDATVLLTFSEFDHYPMRAAAQYSGIWPPPGGKPPSWPSGDGKRIYAYLQPFPARRTVLSQLRELECPMLVSAAGIDWDEARELSTEKLHFVRSTLNLRQVAKECDLAVLNGNHATTILMHLAGTPVLQLPLYLEQSLNAEATVRLGAGYCARLAEASRISQIADQLLNNRNYTETATRFARKYAQFNPRKPLAAAMDRLDGLLQ